MRNPEDYEYERRGKELLNRIGRELVQQQDKSVVKTLEQANNDITVIISKPKTIQLNLDLDI
jgi:hypothetical protein